LQRLKFAGVRVLYLGQQIDSANAQAETLLTVHGLVDQLYLTEMAKKIKRGLAGQLARGFATGAITYGYRTVAVPDPSGKLVNGSPALLGKRVEIVPDQVRTLVDIFTWFADGMSTARIAQRLNADGRPAPRGTHWRCNAVSRMLQNEKYTGKLIWGKTTQERRPGTRQHVSRANPRAQWTIQARPELRIVSEALWARVQARRAEIRAQLPAASGRTLMRGRNAALYSRQLLAGFLFCQVCGRRLSTVSCGHGSPRYGCFNAWRNGVTVCTNRVTVRAKVADAGILDGLRTELLRPETLAYIADRVTSALNARLDDRPRLLSEAETSHDDATRRLNRLITAIEQGAPAAALAPRIVEQQAEIARLAHVVASLAEPVADRVAVMPGLVRQHLEDLVRLLAEAPERLKTEFSRLGLRVAMEPRRDSLRAHYRAHVSLTVGSLPGLGGVADLAPRSPTAHSSDHVSGASHLRNLEHFSNRSPTARWLPRAEP
jgi:hypothetical protein